VKSGRPTDQRYEAIRRLIAKGWTLQAIGDKYNLTRERVRQIVGNVGYDRAAFARRKLRDNLEQVLKMWESGATFKAIARFVGVSTSALQQLGLPRNFAPIPHGTASGYGFHHCRCLECRSNNAKRIREYYRFRRINGLCIQCGKPSPNLSRCRKCSEHNLAKKRATP
jgi:DNA-binding CsgD family transcriptional regulator